MDEISEDELYEGLLAYGFLQKNYLLYLLLFLFLIIVIVYKALFLLVGMSI